MTDEDQSSGVHETVRPAYVVKWADWIPLVLVLGLVVSAVGAVAFWPLRPSGVEEPRPSEARAALGAMKDRARVVYQRTGRIPQTMAELDMPRGVLAGSEFQPADYVVLSGNANEWKAKCIGVFDKEPRDLVVTADLVGGRCTFNR